MEKNTTGQGEHLVDDLTTTNSVKKSAESIYSPADDTKKIGNYRAIYPIDQDIAVTPFELKMSKDQALKLAVENSVGSGIVQSMVDGTIGSGLSLEATVSANILTVNRDKIARNSQKIEELWNLWSETKEACDANGEQTLGQMLRAAAFNAYATGDVLQFIGIHKWQGIYVPFVRFYDGRSVSARPTPEDNNISGVRVDAKGKVVGYTIMTEKSLFNYEYTDVNRYAKYPGSDLDRMQYNLIRTGVVTPTQKRGRPILLPVVGDLVRMGKFTEAELVKAVLQSYITAFIERDKDMLDHIPDASAATDPLLGQLMDDRKTGEVGDYDKPVTMGPGFTVSLNPGEKLNLAESKSPVTEFWKFIEGNLKLVCMGVGLPFEVVLQVFNSNYSASQAAIQAAARRWDLERKLFASQAMTSLYELFVWLLVQQDIINCPGYMEKPFVRAAWNNAKWHGPVVLNIDPVKNATAATLRLNNMTSTYEDESRLWGKDFDKVVERRSQEKAMMEEAGLTSDLSVQKREVVEGEEE